MIFHILTDDICAENSDCKPGWFCKAEQCKYPPGKVLLKSVVFRGFQVLPDSSEVTTVLYGEKTHPSPQGVSCDFTFNHSTDIQSPCSGGKITIADEESLGGCWEVDRNLKCIISIK